MLETGESPWKGSDEPLIPRKQPRTPTHFDPDRATRDRTTDDPRARNEQKRALAMAVWEKEGKDPLKDPSTWLFPPPNLNHQQTLDWWREQYMKFRETELQNGDVKKFNVNPELVCDPGESPFFSRKRGDDGAFERVDKGYWWSTVARKMAININTRSTQFGFKNYAERYLRDNQPCEDDQGNVATFGEMQAALGRTPGIMDWILLRLSLIHI